jgi:hypothetical protein
VKRDSTAVATNILDDTRLRSGILCARDPCVCAPLGLPVHWRPPILKRSILPKRQSAKARQPDLQRVRRLVGPSCAGSVCIRLGHLLDWEDIFLFGIFPLGVGASHCLKEKKKTPDANIIHHATGQGRESDVRINFTGGVGYRSRPNSRCTRALGWHSGLMMDLNKVRLNARECWRNECERSAISQCCHLVITLHHATDARLGHFAASTL